MGTIQNAVRCFGLTFPPLLSLSSPFFLPFSPLFPLPLSIPAECEVSDDSSGEAELEQEVSDLEEVREVPAGLVLSRAARSRNLPLLAAALAHGADVNWANEEDEGKTPLMQAVSGVRVPGAGDVGWDKGRTP